MGTNPSFILNTVRGFFKSILEKMMIEERTIYLENRLDTKANGYYPRKMSSIYGEIPDLQIPRTRDSDFRSCLLPKGKIDPQLENLIAQLYSTGVSTRRIENVLIEQFGVNLSHASIARLSSVTEEEVNNWKERSLPNFAVIFIDAFYFPFKRDHVEKEAVYVALGITPEGHREVIGFWIPGGAEGASNWEEIFKNLRSRGVSKVDYIVADGLTGIGQAISRVYPEAQYQYCILHACRSSLNKSRASDKAQLAKDLKDIYFADSKIEAKKALELLINKWKKIYPKITSFWEDNFENLTTFMSLPNRIWRYVYTTNWVERLHKEIKRRINSMEQFQNVLSGEKILYVQYADQNKRYKNSGVNGWKDVYKTVKPVK